VKVPTHLVPTTVKPSMQGLSFGAAKAIPAVVAVKALNSATASQALTHFFQNLLIDFPTKD
jgi:hypothetical protein